MLEEIEKIYFPAFCTARKRGCSDGDCSKFELSFKQEGEFSNV